MAVYGYHQKQLIYKNCSFETKKMKFFEIEIKLDGLG